VSSSFRRSVRLREVLSAPGASKMCPLPLTGGYECKVLEESAYGGRDGAAYFKVGVEGGG